MINTYDSAYKQALETGWTQELEDICYEKVLNNFSETFELFDFTLDIVGANLVRYLNCISVKYMVPGYPRSIMMLRLRNWIRFMVFDGKNSTKIELAINDSQLEFIEKDELIKYYDRLLAELVMK